MFGRPSGTDFASFLSAAAARRAPAQQEHLGRFALVGIADHEAAVVERDLRAEALDVLPVHRGEHVNRVLHAFDGWQAMRSSAAASPPRICGPEERVMMA